MYIRMRHRGTKTCSKLVFLFFRPQRNLWSQGAFTFAPRPNGSILENAHLLNKTVLSQAAQWIMIHGQRMKKELIYESTPPAFWLGGHVAGKPKKLTHHTNEYACVSKHTCACTDLENWTSTYLHSKKKVFLYKKRPRWAFFLKSDKERTHDRDD